MEPGSEIDPDDHNPEPVHHGPREDSNAAASPSPSAVAAAGGAAASSPSPSPPPAAPVDRPQEPFREQGVGGTHGSSSAAAGVDQKGKGPAEGEERKKKAKEGKGKSSQAKKTLWRKIKSFFSLKKKIVARERWKIYSQHVGRKILPINQVGYYHRMPIHVNLDAYSGFRPVYGDGECFYRSFIFSYLEQVLDRQDTHEEHRLLGTVERVSTEYTNLGWTFQFWRSYEETHNFLTVVACHQFYTVGINSNSKFTAFRELINDVIGWKTQGRRDHIVSTHSYRKDKLLEFFGTYATTEDMVAIQICSHGNEYVQLIPELSENYSLKDWCSRSVIRSRTHTDHVMMAALGAALEVPLKVERLDGAGGTQDICIGPGVVTVTLLYTGDHYGILYPHAPPAESSSRQAS